MKIRTIALLICCMIGMNYTAHASSKVFEPSDIFANLREGDKVAILMVHFGTTHDDTRALTIDALNSRAREVFPQIEVREAYTSRIVIKRLGDRGILKHNPAQVLQQLKIDGYTHILVLTTAVIDGVEMESLNYNMDMHREEFKEIRVSTPLLYFEGDYTALIDIITRDTDPHTAYVWVGHGTYDPSTAQYVMLDRMLKESGYPNHFVGCIEGYPYYEQMILQLRASGLKKVVLSPLMFVGGEHAKNDIAEDWRTQLEQDGFTVDVVVKGLGENPAIRDRYIESLKFTTKNRRLSIMEKKQVYEVTGEKLHGEEHE